MLKLNQKTILSLLLTVFLLVLFAQQAQAAIVNPVIGNLGTNDGASDGSKFINYTVYLWRTSISLGALAVIVFFIWGAFEWITSGSDSKKAESARSRMTNAIIGLVILVSSFTLLSFISKILFGNNFDLLRLTIPTQITGESSATPTAAPSATPNNSGLSPLPGTNRLAEPR